MSEPARNRFALDLEDLERQLRGAAQPVRPGQSVDPLAELTRIVGQDDPLKGLFAQRGPAQPPASVSRIEPRFHDAPQPAAPASAPPAELRGALDEFEALLRRTEPQRPAAGAENAQPEPAPRQEPDARQDTRQDARQDPDFESMIAQAYVRPAPAPAEAPAPRDLDEGRDDYGYAYDPPPAGAPAEDEPAPRRSRKGLMTAAAMLAVGVVGVGGIFALQRGGGSTGPGEPPVIAADRGPTKVEPVNPGGADIPNQNKQIYDRASAAPAQQAKVVSREEQPIDVQQAARSLTPRVVSPDGVSNPLAQAPAAPERPMSAVDPGLVPSPPVPGLGEPRRVRTVSVRPDGTQAPTPATAAYAAGAAPQAAAPRQPSPPVASPTTTATAAPRPRPAAPAEPPKAQERVATPAPATTPTSAPLRIASAAPTATPAPARGGTGEFAVQLAAPGSESEARATFAALQRKFPDQLSSEAPIVRKTELAGGKTVYRLRVGPYSRDEATTMCNQLSAAGGQCFIAKN